MALDNTLAYIKTRSPVKVFVVFTLGILLPNLFLGYLGLRSYRYENRLMHKEAEERFAVVANLIESKVNERVTTLIAELRAISGQPSFQRLDYAAIMPHLLTRIKLEPFVVDELLVFNDLESMVAPWPADSKRTAPVLAGRDFDWGPIAEEIERLERLEFVNKNVKAALQGYIALQSRKLTPSIQAELLKNIAGDQRKLKQTHLAASAYRTLATTYESMQDLSGVPMGILGRQMEIELEEQDHSWKSALDLRLDLFEGLLLRRWHLTESQSANLLAEQRNAIVPLLKRKAAEALAEEARWQHLLSMQASIGSLERAAERFTKENWPDLIRRVRRLGRLDQGAILEITASHPPQVAIIVPIVAPQTDHRLGLLIAILPAAKVWADFDDVMVQLAKPAGLKAQWNHSAEPPSKPQFWTTRLERVVPAIDPPLRFQLVEADSSAREDLSRRRQQIFGTMIGISFTVLLVGLLITFHAVKRETELANLKSDFVANVSHELRTPLAAISHIGERLSLGRYRSDEERKEFYGLLGQETFRLKQLVEDVLDFSKMLAGKKVYRQESLDLVDVVQDSINAFQSKAESRGFQVSSHLASSPITMVGDARAIKQAVLNLLDNAMKYSGDSRAIDLRVSHSPPHAIVTVSDHGIGIADCDKDKIFEKFYRVERGAQGQTEGGVGLGLAMVKHVVEGHHGKIEVESQIGKGSTFSLIFALAK